MIRFQSICLKHLLVVLIVLLIATNLFTAYKLAEQKTMASKEADEPRQEEEEEMAPLPGLKAFTRVFELISRDYYKSVEPEDLLRGAIQGMVQSLEDPLTSYLDPQEYQEFIVRTTGSFSGIGVHIIDVDGSIMILDLIPGTPAEKAGLFPGDRIISIGGVELEGLDVDQAAELLRGPRGSQVSITVKRPGAEEPLTFSLLREDIKSETVTSRRLPSGPGYIRISSFDSFTGEQFTHHLQQLEEEGLEKGLILDLRDNPGGLLGETLKVCKLLVPEGEITRLVDRYGQVREIHYSYASPRPYPMVVLVNERTASAAEILAGALQDREAALLVGTKTYGKATVQNVARLDDGGALRLTIAKYVTPSGRDIQGQGLEPDLEVEFSSSLRFYRAFIPGRLQKGQYGAAVKLLQEMLLELGYSVSPTGIFDQATASALSRFQAKAGIAVNGIFDDVTWLHFREALEEAARERDPQLKRAEELLTSPGMWAQLRR